MKKKTDWLTIVLIIILAASISGAGFFAYKIFAAEREYRQGVDIYDNVANMAVLRDNVKTTNTASAEEFVEVTDNNISSDFAAKTPTITTEEIVLENTQFQTPTPTAAAPASQMNFKELLSVNPEVVGWITLPDSKINYPIMHGKDNDYYLYHAITGEWNKVGTPYVDFRNRGDFTDRISVVYGHYMENGTMFTDFHKFKSQKYYDEHKTALLYTPDGDFTIEFVAGVIKDVDNWDFTLKFETNEEYVRYLTNNFKLQSTFKSDIEIAAEDKYVIFSLCSYDVDNGRYLLLGRLVPIK